MKSAKPNVRLNLHLARFLFSYRTTQHSTTGQSPAELLQGRKLRTKLDLLRPDLKSHVEDMQQKMKEQYNKKTKMRTLAPGQEVMVRTFSRNEEHWTRGTIHKATGPVSYLVMVNGRSMKRHVDHIREALPDAPAHQPAPPPKAGISAPPQQQPRPARRNPSRSTRQQVHYSK